MLHRSTLRNFMAAPIIFGMKTRNFIIVTKHNLNLLRACHILTELGIEKLLDKKHLTTYYVQSKT